ncbi:hypothetical protein Tco_1100488 [Tanacetum coccineum]
MRQLVPEPRCFETDLMVVNDKEMNDHVNDGVQDIETLQADVRAQGTTLTNLEQRVNCNFRRLEQRFEDIVERLDVLVVNANRNMIDDETRQGTEVNILSFNGTLAIEDFVDWLAEVDRFFKYMEIPEDQRVRLVACRLKGCASAWWERLQVKRYRKGKQPIRTWYRMKQLLQKDFLPPDYEQILFQPISKMPLRYLGGLKPQIREKIGAQVLWTLNEAKNTTMRVELMLQDKGTRRDSNRRGYRGDNYNKNTTKNNKTVLESTSNVDRKEDKLVGKRNIENEESQKTSNPYTKPTSGKCFRCNKPRHMSNEYPKRKSIHMVDKDEVEDVFCEPDGNEYDDELEYEDEYQPINVIRKLMLAPKQEDHNSGSCENIIGRKIVKLLQLPIETHLKPYSIGWIKAAERIHVKERCKVPFSIGRYSDKAVFSGVQEVDDKQSRPYPETLKLLLEEFGDVLPQELPDDLPPM